MSTTTVRKPAKVERMPVAEPRSLLAVLASATTNPAVDLDKMERLYAMQREIERDLREAEFNTSLLQTQRAIPRVVKDRPNEHTKSKYATLEAVSTAIDSIAHKNGLSLSFGTADSPLASHYRIVCDLQHTNGLSRRYHVDLQADASGPQGKSNKNPVQAVGSTISYGRRYLKILIFDVAIVGEDTDGRPALEPITYVQLEQLTDYAAAEDCSMQRLVGFLNDKRPNGHPPLTDLADLPVVRFQDAKAAIKSYGVNRRAREQTEEGTPHVAGK